MKKLMITIVVIIILIILGVLIFSPKPSQDLDEAIVVDRATGSSILDESVKEDSEENNKEEVAGNTPVNVPNSALDFSFVGFGPGKSHVGTFEEYTISDVVVNEEGVPISGQISFAVDSVKTDSSVLDGHLCGEGFFDCANHKNITFVADSATSSDGINYSVTGDITVKGQTKTIKFPVVIKEGKATADFKINMKQFGFGAPTVNEEVQIKFTGSL